MKKLTEQDARTSTDEERRSKPNEDFIRDVFRKVPPDAHIAVCSKSGDPDEGGWTAQRMAEDTPLPVGHNNYLNCSSFRQSDEDSFNVKKENFAALHFQLLDDLGTKVPMDRLREFKLSWLIETSPGNFQGGIILAEPITNVEQAELLDRMIRDSGYSDKGASGVSRWARLPEAINGKSKHQVNGKPFQCRLVEWHPDHRYTMEQISEALDLKLDAEKPQKVRPSVNNREDDDIYTAAAEENPVLKTLKERGLYKADLGQGKHDITCPWCHEHTDQLDSGCAYWEPNKQYLYGGFRCLHSHGDTYRMKEFLNELGISYSQAINQSCIRVIQGEIHRTVDIAERELALNGEHYESGGLITTIAINRSTGDSSIEVINNAMLTRTLSEIANWEKYDGRANDFVRCDPPPRCVAILNDSRRYRHLPTLSGLARQPFLREIDGELVQKPGYDQASGLFGVFDGGDFYVPDEPTLEDARDALNSLQELLKEFRFGQESDRATALSAICTATVRPTLPHAPAYHIKAPAPGSGKSYLSELIGAFAGPGKNAKVSFPKTSEEATKVILSLLLTNPAVIEFDDMDTDWLPHGVLNRALTAEYITDRILGHSKTATVNTRSLFLGSGNNVGPVRDLRRRVATINIDPKIATPSTIEYQGKPVETVRQNRGHYVSAVLTIIKAWKIAGSPKAEVDPIATYNGLWADYCRHSLMWLGLHDPATSLLEQVKHDPDSEALGALLQAWHEEFGSIPTTVRKVIEVTIRNDSLMEALREFPVEDKTGFNHSKVGWIMKRNENRIVGNLQFQKDRADGRTAWKVVKLD